MKKLFLILFIPFLSFGQIVTEDCNSIPDPGICLAYIQIFYFNQTTSQCEESYWGGCGGVVPFWTLEECQNSCENTEVEGCTDEDACNYDSTATVDDGLCIYQGDECVVAVGLNGEIIYGMWNADCSECVYDNTVITEFSSYKKIIKVIDILSRETTNKGLQLHIYDDGSVEKKYLIH